MPLPGRPAKPARLCAKRLSFCIVGSPYRGAGDEISCRGVSGAAEAPERVSPGLRVEGQADEIGHDAHQGLGVVDGIVLGAKLKLERVDKSASLERAREYLSMRRAKQPIEPSLGSVFKNGDIPAGKLIEECGLKGTQIGGAKISEKHANIIVNTGGATVSDYLALVKLCEIEVKTKFNIQLEREFKLIK